jgi:thioredoxin-dependent peroxiredoxin
MERTGLVTFHGKPITLIGDGEVAVGQTVPDFRVSKSVADDLAISELRGRVVVLNVIPSIDTSVCSKQTETFNTRAAEYRDKVIIVTISMDLPFALERWCRANAADIIVTTSDYKYQEFGRNFGLLMKGFGLLARSVWVIDAKGVLRYSQIVPDMGSEPDYDAALAAVKGLL